MLLSEYYAHLSQLLLEGCEEMEMNLKKSNKNDWRATIYIPGCKVKNPVLFGLEKVWRSDDFIVVFKCIMDFCKR